MLGTPPGDFSGPRVCAPDVASGQHARSVAATRRRLRDRQNRSSRDVRRRRAPENCGAKRRGESQQVVTMGGGGAGPRRPPFRRKPCGLLRDGLQRRGPINPLAKNQDMHAFAASLTGARPWNTMRPTQPEAKHFPTPARAGTGVFRGAPGRVDWYAERRRCRKTRQRVNLSFLGTQIARDSVGLLRLIARARRPRVGDLAAIPPSPRFVAKAQRSHANCAGPARTTTDETAH